MIKYIMEFYPHATVIAATQFNCTSKSCGLTSTITNPEVLVVTSSIFLNNTTNDASAMSLILVHSAVLCHICFINYMM